MPYIVHPLLHSTSHAVLWGFTNQSLTRWGGVIRIAAGHPGAGQIVAHLRDFGPDPVPQALTSVLRLGHVAAAASVLNLGVSVAGTALLARKLGQLQADMNRVFAVLDQNHRELTGALGNIQSHLVELRYLAARGRDMLAQAIEEARKIRQDLFLDHAARLLADQQLLSEPSLGHGALETTLRSCRATRNWLELTLDADPLSADRPHRWADLFARLRTWCFAAAVEVACLRRLGMLPQAVEASAQAATSARTRLTAWTARLLPEAQLGGIHRFGFSHFAETLPEEVHERLMRLASGALVDPFEQAEQRLEASYLVAQALPSLPATWLQEQTSLAQVLDFFEETTERLESLSFEMQRCQREGLGHDDWEALALPANASIGLLTPEGALS